LDFSGPITGPLKSPRTTSYRSSIETIPLNCLVFEKIAFLYFGDKQTDRRTDGQARCNKPLSLSRAAVFNTNKQMKAKHYVVDGHNNCNYSYDYDS